tara:strand:- start:449 stop:994 length:546 start_codon:yes stop_codon:yes gene_type:complete
MNMINTNFLIFDYIVIIISIIIIIFSTWKGFINSILGLLTWVGSVFITIYTYEYLSNYLNKIFLNISFLNNFEQFVAILTILISIPLIFLLSLFILKRIRKVISSDLDKQILGIIFDKFFGAIYGLIFTYVIFSTLLYFTNNNISILKNLNNFFIENSNVLIQIHQYNENIIQIYSNNLEE